MIQTASGLSKARPPARLFRAWTWLAGALALLPVARTWQLTGDTDTTVTTLAVFAGAAWQFRLLLGQLEDRPNPGTRWVALALLGLGIWQLAWIGVDDFWFLRLALVLWAAVWLLLAWGWVGWVLGWRILASFVIWAAFCDSPWQWTRDAYQSGDWMGPALAVVTAQVAGGILWICGAPVRSVHNLIQLGSHVVSVGVPCTALPLVKLLLLLLALATLLLRLRWQQALRLAALTVLVSFVISLGRVMILAYVVRDPPLFHYWHDADGGGGGWFTALGMLIIAFLTVRQMFRQYPPPPDKDWAERPLTRPPAAAWIVLASFAAWGLAQFATIQPSRSLSVPLSSPDFSMVSDSITWKAGGPSTAPEPNEPIWVRRISYAARSGSQRVNLVVALIPHTLTGDPRDHPSLTSQIPLAGRWNVPNGARYALLQSGKDRAWETTVVAAEPSVATAAGWNEHLQRGLVSPRRWLAWLAHRSPLRDKRSYWLGAYTAETSASSSGPAGNLFTAWIADLAHSF